MKRIIVMLMLAVCSFGTLTQANAQTAQTATTKHVKKDGTADKRFAENKTAKSKAAVKAPVTKSGKPDMRYKANKTDSAKKKKA